MTPPDLTPLTDEEIAELERLEREAWVAPWVAHTFEIDCPCPNGEDCGDLHTCEQIEAPEAYPASPEDPAAPGDGQCVVQIAVPGLESLAGPTAAFIAAARNALGRLLAEVRQSRGADVTSLLEAAAEITEEPSMWVEDRDSIRERKDRARRIRALIPRRSPGSNDGRDDGAARAPSLLPPASSESR